MTETPIADQLLFDESAQPDGYVFPTFPATAIPVEGVPLRGRFVRLDQGPEGEYGTPWIVVFDAVDGLYKPAVNAGDLPLEPGQRYGLWLIHSVLREQMRAARPAPGEMFAVLYKGQKIVRGTENATKPRQYYAYQVDMPERSAPATATSWDAVAESADETQPDF